MKKLKYLLPVLTGVILFSCKGKQEEQKISSEQNIEEKEQAAPQKDIKITSTDFEGIQNLADIKSDTLYVTNYWATWCGPCIVEIPHFVELQNEYKDKKVKFTFVNIEPKEDIETVVKPFVLKYNMENVYQIPPMEMLKFRSMDPELAQGIPVTIIQKGNKKEGFIGSRDKAFLEQKIQEYLK